MKARSIALSTVLALLTIVAYLPAYGGQFIWDDDRHIQHNNLLHSTAGLWRIWFDLGATPQYYPLTHTTFWIEWHLWGNAVLGYHIVNVLLHIVAALLVVRLLKFLEVPGAWLAGFVFALHPLHVESVAWMSERKNTLSIVFLLASVLVYLRWSLIATGRRGWWSAFVLFLCATLSKTVAGVMPAVVLVILVWKHRRLRSKDVLPLLPFFAVSLAAAAVTGRMEREVVGAEGDDWSLSFVQRLLVASRALWWYAWKLIWPSELMFSYPRWRVDSGSAVAWSFFVALIVFALVVFVFRRRLGGGAIAAMLIFAGALFPALGFFNLFPHRYSFVADHFQYYSDVAGIALLCAGATLIGQRLPGWLARTWALLLILTLATMSYAQARIYKDGEAIWFDTIAKNPDSWLAYHNVAASMETTRADKASLEEALAYLRKAEQIRPQHDRVHVTLGETLTKLGRTDEAQREYDIAIAQYRAMIAANPSASAPYYRLATLYDALGRRAEATDVLLAATRALPKSTYFLEAAITHLTEQNRQAEALSLVERWTALRPDDLTPHVKAAYLYGTLGRVMDARRELNAAAAISPDDPEVLRGMELVKRSLLHEPAATSPARD